MWEHVKGGVHLMGTIYSTNFKDIQERILRKQKPEQEEKTEYKITIKKIK